VLTAQPMTPLFRSSLLSIHVKERPAPIAKSPFLRTSPISYADWMSSCVQQCSKSSASGMFQYGIVIRVQYPLLILDPDFLRVELQ
jgi:hypothetical protein